MRTAALGETGPRLFNGPRSGCATARSAGAMAQYSRSVVQCNKNIALHKETSMGPLDGFLRECAHLG